MYADLGEDRLQFNTTTVTTNAASSLSNNDKPTYYSTAIHGNYSITPATDANLGGRQFHSIVLQKQDSGNGGNVFTI